MSYQYMISSLSVLILTGGTSRRFGSDKSEALIGGRALIDHLIDEIPTGVPIVIVGPPRAAYGPEVQVIQESPALGGPVAAIAAGLALVQTELVAIFATDMPFGSLLIPQLLTALEPKRDAVLPIDSAGFAQPLSALYRASSLQRALSALPDVKDESMRNLVATLNIVKIPINESSAHLLLDIDTQSDLTEAVSSYKEMNPPLTSKEGR